MNVRRTACFLGTFLVMSMLIGSIACGQMAAAPSGQSPVMTGMTWQQLSPDEKVAFVSGVGQFAAVEREWAQKKGDTDILGYRFAQGIAGVPINDIIQKVDRYYANNPGQLEKPVLRVVWETVAKPNLAMNR